MTKWRYCLSWGTTLHAVVESLPTRNWPDLLVVPISGGLGAPEWEVQGTDLTRRMAQSLGAGLRYLPAPSVVANPLVRQALMENPQVGDTLATEARTTVADQSMERQGNHVALPVGA